MERKPNLIVICSDEHHFRYMGHQGHPQVQTPNLDALAAVGTSFSRAYCNSPVCTPSRMSFITGKYVSQIGSWFIGVPLDNTEATWPSRLAQCGIDATMIGKMDFCGPYQSGGFTDYKIIERRGAYDPYPRNAPLGSRLPGYVRGDKIAHLKRSGIRKTLFTNGSNGHDDALGFYDHDRMVTQWSIEYLRERAAQDNGKPFVLYIGYLFPHWPYTCPEEYMRLYDPDSIALPHDCVIPDNPALHPAVRNFQRACNLGEATEADVRRSLAAYMGMITCMDDMIGKVIGELKALGLYDNTGIIYTSDHGDNCGEHGLFYKQCSYDGSAAVPLIMTAPGIPGGHVVDTPVTLVDLYPTILDLYGLQAEEDRPGSSLLSLARGEGGYGMDYAFCEYHGNFFPDSWYMLVKDNLKYTYYVDDTPTLFDLESDPREILDLAAQPEYAEKLVEFETILRGILDPEAVDFQSKRDLGLIGPQGQDYTKSLDFHEASRMVERGELPAQPEFVEYNDYRKEY